MKKKKNWRYRLAVSYYEFFGIDITKVISNEKRFQRAIDLTILLTTVAILGTVFPFLLFLLGY